MTNPTATIKVTTSYMWLSFFQDLCSPVIELDGKPHRRSWGTHSFQVTPGRHEVTAYHRWMFIARAYESGIYVDVKDGETVEIRWRTGWSTLSPGKWTTT
jgi:hypothetical protein